jgi:hypothetical protein
MKRTIVLVVCLLASKGLIWGQDWTQLGFKAEPGVSVGTPCVLNLMARFWLGNFGISGCGLYLPTGFNYLNGYGGEADVMYKLMMPRQLVEPYVALGYGWSNISTALSGAPALELLTNYVGLQVGAYYQGAFAQLGLGVGIPPNQFTVLSNGSKVGSLPVWPLIQIGYVGSIGGTK